MNYEFMITSTSPTRRCLLMTPHLPAMGRRLDDHRYR
jgi:hypothetical protein